MLSEKEKTKNQENSLQMIQILMSMISNVLKNNITVY